MADNFTPNAPTTAAAFSFAADQVGSDPTSGKPVLVPRVKVQFGDDGTAADVSAAAPLPVADAAVAAAIGEIMAAMSTAIGQAAQLAVLQAIAASVDSVEAPLSSLDAKTPALVGGLSPVRIGGSAVALDLVTDSAGTVFSPSSGDHAYAYDGGGNIITDTCTIGAVVRVKTYGWTSGRMTSETKWVVQ